MTCEVKLFADDTVLYVTNDKSDDVSSMINVNRNTLQDWADQCFVTFNQNKTKVMYTTNKVNRSHIIQPLFLNDTELTDVNEHKHLGLIINNKLKWTSHIDEIIKKTSRLFDVLNKLKYVFDRKTLYNIYFTFVRPKIEYGCVIWDDCTEQDKTRLMIHQLKFTRLMTGAKRGTSHELFHYETS